MSTSHASIVGMRVRPVLLPLPEPHQTANGSLSVSPLVLVDITGVKARVGYPTVEDDRAVIQAIRSAVGDDVAIMVDYNQSLSVDEAIKRMAVLDAEGLTWVEEPTLGRKTLPAMHE